MTWLIIAVCIFVLWLVYKGSSSSFKMTSNFDESIPQLLELVKKKGYVLVDSHIENQYLKNKVGWYLNSYNFVEDYNQSDIFIVEVDFKDNVKRIGDISKIVLKLNPNPKPLTQNK